MSDRDSVHQGVRRVVVENLGSGLIAVAPSDEPDRVECELHAGDEQVLAEVQVRQEQDTLRLILPTPNWDDFVDLAFSEIRLYGASNFQVARRLYAIVEGLLNDLPETRHAALRRQRHVLNETLERLHLLPEDLALARQADRQGLGGSSTPYG